MSNTTESPYKDVITDVNQHWMIYAGSLVFLMQAGFSLLEAGSVGAKNATNILFKNLLDACISAACFYAWGYSFAASGGNFFIGHSNFFLTGEDGNNYRSFFFQWAFAATAATIVSGAVAERIKLPAYFIYSFVITSIIYPIVVHWVWADDGFMCNWHKNVDTEPFIENSVNLIDFAGSGVVHLTGGICALVGAIFTGPRIGRFEDSRFCGCFQPNNGGRVIKHEAHNRVHASLGVLILWFGWYGFNGGSTLDISGYGATASRVAVTTTLSAAAGALATMFVSMLYTKPVCQNFDVMAPLNGILAGLVSITAGCAHTTPQGALGIGCIGGLVYMFSSWLLKNLRIDDPLDAFSVHGACGIWGVIATGFFGVKKYICDGKDNINCVTTAGQTAMQFVGVLFIIVWTTLLSTILFAILKAVGLLRASEKAEIRGLDYDHHLGYTGILRYSEEYKLTNGDLDVENARILPVNDEQKQSS